MIQRNMLFFAIVCSVHCIKNMQLQRTPSAISKQTDQMGYVLAEVQRGRKALFLLKNYLTEIKYFKVLPHSLSDKKILGTLLRLYPTPEAFAAYFERLKSDTDKRRHLYETMNLFTGNRGLSIKENLEKIEQYACDMHPDALWLHDYMQKVYNTLA